LAFYFFIFVFSTLIKNQLFASIEAGTAVSGSWQIPECLLEREKMIFVRAGDGVVGVRGKLRILSPLPLPKKT
jgi:hypothetical protein